MTIVIIIGIEKVGNEILVPVGWNVAGIVRIGAVCNFIVVRITIAVLVVRTNNGRLVRFKDENRIRGVIGDPDRAREDIEISLGGHVQGRSAHTTE